MVTLVCRKYAAMVTLVCCASQSSREQLAIAAFAQSLLVIPNTLTVNAARDATDLVPKLRAFHHSSQVKAEHQKLKYYGLDLMEGKQTVLSIQVLNTSYSINDTST